MIKMVLLVAAIPVVLVGSVRLAVRVLRWVRRNRGEASWALSSGFLTDRLTDAIDGWLSRASPSGSDHFDGGHHGGSDADHSGDSHHSGSGGDHG